MSKKAEKQTVKKRSKLLRLFYTVILLAVTGVVVALVMIINPFNIYAIVKNNYPDLPIFNIFKSKN